MLQNLMSIIAAMVSSSGLIRVGPKHTPILATLIRFLALLDETLKMDKNRDVKLLLQ